MFRKKIKDISSNKTIFRKSKEDHQIKRKILEQLQSHLAKIKIKVLLFVKVWSKWLKQMNFGRQHLMVAIDTNLDK
jgi:hypothetical protein